MVLWCEKYRPQTLPSLTLHPTLTNRLQHLLASPDFPHLLVYGPSGAGKSTRVHAILRALFGRSIDKARLTNRSIKVNSRTVEIGVLSSNYHIAVNASEVGVADRIVIQELIAEMAQTTNVAAVTASTSTSNSSFLSGNNTNLNTPSETSSALRAFKILVLTEVDHLSMSAQQALRRTMEQYTSTCRIILVSESISRVIAPLRSRCLPIRVPAPSEEQTIAILQHISHKEDIVCSEDLARSLMDASGGNLRKAILMLEACKVRYPSMKDSDSDVLIRQAEWESFIDHIGRLICEEQSPERLLLVRGKLYELITNCIPPDVILVTLTEALLKRVDDQIKYEIIKSAALFSSRIAIGSKPIFHLEAFVAQFMALYKKWVVDIFT